MYSEDRLRPISALQHLVFCARQCALIHLEGAWADNSLTVEGTHLHEKVDGPERREVRGDVVIVRGLQLRSLQLFYGAHKRRHLVAIDGRLRRATAAAVASLHQLLDQGACFKVLLHTPIPPSPQLPSRLPFPSGDSRPTQLCNQRRTDGRWLAAGRQISSSEHFRHFAPNSAGGVAPWSRSWCKLALTTGSGCRILFLSALSTRSSSPGSGCGCRTSTTRVRTVSGFTTWARVGNGGLSTSVPSQPQPSTSR